MPDFHTLADALYRLDAGFSAAEVHGMATAVLVHDRDHPPQQWLGRVLKGDPMDYHWQETSEMLLALYRQITDQLNGGSMAFDLLLPPEQQGLAERVQGLQQWCQGFAYGIALSGLSSLESLPADSREWVQDVIRIGAAGELGTDNEDESETALMELEEFLRVGVLMMNEEVQPLRGRISVEGVPS
ncbi:MAG: UPF0149 family protein [Thiothrix sp.]|nr:UPF0149 family protein [Thiothrix sp.]HPE60923.1 YecA family protein [Thiolinea sp.]